MFGAAGHPNAVYVPLVQTGCLKSQFDSTYPIHLNGIISQDEFQESIGNINQTISSRKSLIFSCLIFTLCLVGGMVLFVVGGITAVTSRTYGFPVLVGVGFGVFTFGMIFMVFGCCCIQLRRMGRMRRAIAEESAKYSTRSLTPCSWRLDALRTWGGGYQRQRTSFIYRIAIEMANTGAPGSGSASYQFNQFAPQSSSFFSQENNLPPPYSSQSTAGFCSGCGMQRQNFTVKFCPSCGRPFNI